MASTGLLLRVAKLLRYAATVRQQTGKGFFRQLTEVLTLANGGNRLGAAEYYEFEVFKDEYFSTSGKERCVGWRASTRKIGRAHV